jgi:predicted SAM-dependent methyltransferase
MAWFNDKPVRLHIGAGDKRLDGWVNVDLKRLPGVDVVADVTKGLRFENVEAIFAEHFLEHLFITDALSFLLESHRVLAPTGRLRLSTPNLDWVWLTHYRLDAPGDEKLLQAVRLNRAFRAWGHQFVWNPEILAAALRACGFVDLVWCRYGESEHEVFRGLERHETYGDSPELPHVLIAEASKGEPQPELLASLRAQLHDEFLIHLPG